jgi:hypothetical protein
MTASFTFTADAGTDTITTSAPHGKVTGDGPMVVRNVGGALPTGYTALLDVYAIVTGASTMKLALSSADALANIPILISDAGTGTHYLEIGIPYRRPRTYAPGVQLKSADLNDNFDAWKALYALLTAQAQSVWSGVQLLGLLTANAGVTCAANQHVTLSGTGALVHGSRTMGLDIAQGRAIGSSNVDYQGTALTWSGAGTWDIGIQLPAGVRITGCTVYYSRDSGGTLTFRIGERSTDGSTSFVVSKNVAAGAGAGNTALETSPTSGALPKTLLTGKSYYFSASAGNLDDVTSVEITFDRPA